MKNMKINRLPESIKYSRKAKAVLAVVLAGCLIAGGVKLAGNKSGGSDSYRETTVVRGNLTVGITEQGTVDIGTVEQTFELDMSALQRVTTTNSNSSSSSGSTGGFGGMDSGMGGMSGMSGMGGGSGSSGGSSSSGSTSMFGQMFDLGGSSSTSSSSSDSKLVVESIEIAVGQEIEVGDVILKLESEGVEELKEELEDNVTKASADLEALIADQALSTTTAEYTRDTALKYETYAATEKNETISSLKQDMDSASKSLEEAKTTLSTYQSQLAASRTDYENAVTAMNNAVYSRDNTDKQTDTYLYTQYFTQAETAISNAESLKSKVEQLESRVESAQSNVTKCETNLAKAKRSYASGVLAAEETYQLRLLAYNSAQETYDITVSYLEDDLKEQQETYEETRRKWEEFTSYIDGVNILSEYKGVVTDISLSAGDSLNTGSVVVTLYDADEVTMTVTVAESDMTDIELDGRANIVLTAYPDRVFEAIVTEIGNASSDSNGNTTREVTVTIQGDVSSLFQGMTGTVTFITKQNADVLYVSNRAIIRENGLSYVKVKEGSRITKVQVETGFSDGSNVEILDGLKEGQTVIIEKGES